MMDKVIYIEEQFHCYIHDSLNIISDIVEISVQNNINVREKEDIYIILKEYAKLLPISKT